MSSDINSSWKERLAAAPKQTSVLSLAKISLHSFFFDQIAAPQIRELFVSFFPFRYGLSRTVFEHKSSLPFAFPARLSITLYCGLVSPENSRVKHVSQFSDET